MKRFFFVVIFVCLVVATVRAEQPSSTESRCESCLSFSEAMQKDLPELFGQGAAFAAAGDGLGVWMPAEGGLKVNPNNDTSINSGFIGSAGGISGTTDGGVVNPLPPPPPPPLPPPGGGHGSSGCKGPCPAEQAPLGVEGTE